MNKKISKILGLMLVLVVAIGMLFACKDAPDFSSISVKTVPGITATMELDLATGEIQLDDEAQTVLKMSDEGVTVSGYDKTKEGPQTVTVTYQGISATFTVNASTAVVSKHIKDYFVGERLDTSEGQVKITRADGTSFTRKLNDVKINIDYKASDFDTAGEKTLTFVYENGEERYSGSFTVTVYDVASVTLSVPTKTSYRNYEGELNLKGGSLRVNSDGAFSRTISLDNEAVVLEGYDPTQATEAHRTTPLTQTITVTFGDIQPQTFEVKILYTDVLRVNQLVEELADIDWASETEIPTISEELGKKAMDGMLTYSNMDAEDRYEISDENLLQLSRTALAYSYSLWYDDFMTYGGAFTDDAENGFTYTLTSYDALKAEVVKLKQTDRELYRIGEIVQAVLGNDDIQTEGMGFALVYYLSNKAWGDEITLAEYKEAMDYYGEAAFHFEGFYGWFTFLENATIQEKILPLFDFMLNLKDNMDGIDADFDFATTEHNEQAKTTIDLILKDNVYGYTEYAQIYELVDSWLGGKGFFNLLYTYIYKYENTNIETLNALSQYVLPAELKDLHLSIEECLYYAELFASDLESALENEALQIDTTEFLQQYYAAKKRNEEIKALAASTKERYFYDNITIVLSDGAKYTFDELLENIRIMDGGYYDLLGGGVKNAAVEAWLETFINALYSDNVSGDVVVSLLSEYAAMPSGEQSSVVSALYTYYDEGLTTFAFKNILQKDIYYLMGYNDETLNQMYEQGYISKEDYDSLSNITAQSQFLKLISDYYNGVLQHKQTKDALNKLLQAMDEYLNYGALNGATNEYEQNKFKATFDAIMPSLTNEEALAEFNEHFGALYTLYKERFELNTQDTAPTFGAHQGLVDELIQALKYSFEGVENTYGQSYSTAAILIPHEKAESLVKELLAAIGDDAELMELYENYACYPFSDSVKCSLEYAVNASRSYYYENTRSLGASYTAELKAFMVSCYDTVMAGYRDGFGSTTAPTFNDFAALYATALTWLELSDEDFFTFYMLDLNYTAFYQYTVYYAMTALDTRLTTNVRELVKQFFYIVEEKEDGSVIFPDNLISSCLTLISGNEMDLTDLSAADLATYYSGLKTTRDELQKKLDAVKATVSALSELDQAAFAVVEDIYDALIAKCEAVVARATELLDAQA